MAERRWSRRPSYDPHLSQQRPNDQDVTSPLLVEKKYLSSRRPSALPPMVSVSQESGSSADHSGETVLEVDLAFSPGTRRKVSMAEPNSRRLSAINRSPSPFRLGRRGSRSPYRSREWETEEKSGFGKQRRSSGVAQQQQQQQQQQQRTSTRKREQWARSVRAKTMSARSSLFSVDSEAYPVHPLLRSTMSTSPRPSISGSSSRSSSICVFKPALI